MKQPDRFGCLFRYCPEADMASFDPIPQARVFRHAGELMAPPPAPRTEAAVGHLRTALAYALGLWPLTAVVLLIAGLLVLTAHMGAR
jgi:hypothetical protein